MVNKFFDNSGNGRGGSNSSKEDSNLRPQTCINPPLSQERCWCCGRHISELEPFEKSEEGESEDFFIFDDEDDGKEVLIKRFRLHSPYDEEAEEALKEAEKHLANGVKEDDDPSEWLIEKYGKEEANRLINRASASNYSFSSWECKDCIVLDDDEYFEKKNQSDK